MILVYFASVREAVGVSSEQCDVPKHVRTVGELVGWLATQSDVHAIALGEPVRLRFALDQNMVGAETLLGHAKEFAIFPPVTGG